jgi:hypothetical protein
MQMIMQKDDRALLPTECWHAKAFLRPIFAVLI